MATYTYSSYFTQRSRNAIPRSVFSQPQVTAHWCVIRESGVCHQTLIIKNTFIQIIACFCIFYPNSYSCLQPYISSVFIQHEFNGMFVQYSSMNEEDLYLHADWHFKLQTRYHNYTYNTCFVHGYCKSQHQLYVIIGCALFTVCLQPPKTSITSI